MPRKRLVSIKNINVLRDKGEELRLRIKLSLLRYKLNKC